MPTVISFVGPPVESPRMERRAPVSVSTVVLDGQDLDRGLALLAMAGATSVEPAYIEGYMPFDETTFTEAAGLDLARRLRAAGLGICALSAHTDLGQPASADKLRRRLDFAAAAGARIVISNATTVDRRDALHRTLAAIAPDLAAREMVLALENPGHGTGALLPDGRRGAAVVAAMADPRIRMNYDIGNAASYGGARAGTDDLVAALPVTAHLHLKDLRTQGADWHFCPLGDGDIGYGAELDLARLPPDLPIGIEHPIRLWRPGKGDPRRRDEIPDEASVIAAVRRSLDWLRAALREGPGPYQGD